MVGDVHSSTEKPSDETDEPRAAAQLDYVQSPEGIPAPGEVARQHLRWIDPTRDTKDLMTSEAHLSGWPSDATASRARVDSKRQGNRSLRFVRVEKRHVDVDLDDLIADRRRLCREYVWVVQGGEVLERVDIVEVFLYRNK